MEPYDLVRVGTILLFGVGAGFMILTNIIAWHVLRPAQQLGFLWWHVTSISFAWLLVGGSAAFVVFTRIGDPPALLSVAVLPGMTLFAVAQVIIFSVERSRLQAKRAMKLALDQSDARFR